MLKYLFGLALVSGGMLAQFSDQTQSAGLIATHMPILDHAGWEMEGGGTVGDFNRDGWPDIYVLGGGNAPDRLFINQGDGTFSDEAQVWQAPGPHRGVGAAVGDYDHDGWLDLFLTSLGPQSGPPVAGAHYLLHNHQGLYFEDRTATAGLAYSSPTVPDGFSASFGDYDLDGHLDLFITGWHPNALGNCLFHNNGDGTFSNVTQTAGVYDPDLHGFSPTFADLNNDFYPEIMLSADFGTSKYFANQGDGSFSNLTPSAGCGLETNGMGGTVGDVNNDGLLDWYVTSIYFSENPTAHNGNYLYINQGNDQFVPLPEQAGATDGGWAWGTAFIDFDLDRALDIVATNGWRRDEFLNEPAYLFRNMGGLQFTEVGQSMGLVQVGQGRGLVILDYDRDGDMDVVIFESAGPMSLFRNEHAGGANHWLEVNAVSYYHPQIAPDGLGSRIQVSRAGLTQTAILHAGANYLGNSELQVHFGLGPETAMDQLQVTWPNGLIQTFVLPIDRKWTLYVPHPALLSELLPSWASGNTTCVGQVTVQSLVGLIEADFVCSPLEN